MKILFIILVLSLVTVMVTVLAMWIRLRWHLHRSDRALKHALDEIQSEHEPMDRA